MADEVLLNLDNATKCICPVCPVQAASECIAARRGRWEQGRLAAGEILAEYPTHPEAYDMAFERLTVSELATKHAFASDTSRMIELYCAKSVGASDCEDLDSRQSCQCPTCAVWATHHLDSAYYCLPKK